MWMPNEQKKPKPSMLGAGMAKQAGSVMEIQRRIQEIELRMADNDYVPTQAELSELAQLRGRLQDAMKQK
jgi:hypothetical protein